MLSVEPLYEKNSLTELYCAPACGGKVVAPATKGGTAGMVHEVYDSPVFSSYPSFPLEGKCLEEAKGCTR